MGVYRVDSIANLARQLAFTPVELRAVQIGAAELLLHDIDPAKAYPLDFITYRVTGYRPKLTTRGTDMPIYLQGWRYSMTLAC